VAGPRPGHWLRSHAFCPSDRGEPLRSLESCERVYSSVPAFGVIPRLENVIG
jgi:hypothetical protein